MVITFERRDGTEKACVHVTSPTMNRRFLCRTWNSTTDRSGLNVVAQLQSPQLIYSALYIAGKRGPEVFHDSDICRSLGADRRAACSEEHCSREGFG